MEDSLAIQSLGSLFKITEVFLIDETPVDNLDELLTTSEEKKLNGESDLVKAPIKSSKLECTNEDLKKQMVPFHLQTSLCTRMFPPSNILLYKNMFDRRAHFMQKEARIMGTSFTKSLSVNFIEIANWHNNLKFLKSLQKCYSHWGVDETSCRKKCLDYSGSMENYLARLQRNKFTLQSLTGEVRMKGIKKYDEPMVASYKDDSTIEGLKAGDVVDHSQQREEKHLSLQRGSSSNKEEIKSFSKLLLPGMVEELSVNIIKYWCQRYRLFSKFDNGVKLDEEGWFSVTPEILAKHHAQRCGKGTIVDGFTGVGGNAIQFAQKSCQVIAIDINPKKIGYAQHNARIYGVADCIDFITGDFFQLAPRLKADFVFLSPPWGGPEYAQVENYDIRYMLKPKDGFSLFRAAWMISTNIIMFLPKNVDLNQLAELALLFSPTLALEVEKNYVNGKLLAITAYYSDSAKHYIE